MAKITYTDKETLNEIPSIPAKNKVQAADMNEIKNAVNQNELKILLIVDSSAPAECSTGDMYYNTTTKLIYTATGTDTWGTTGVNPTQNTLYIDYTNKSTYFYDGTDLISVGGGAGGESLKIGTIVPFAGSTIPDGYLTCDGTAVSRTTYSDLFAVIGTTYGAGDGSTTFNLPNLKGKVPVGLDGTDTDFDTLGETGGEKTHQLSISELPSDIRDTTNTGSNLDGYIMHGGYTVSGNYNFGGENQPHNNLQPYLVVHYIIKATKTTPVQAEIVNEYSTSTTDGYSCNEANTLFQTKGQVLWTNANPTSNFGGQTITLSSNDYDYIDIIYNNYKQRNTYESTRVYKEYPASEIGGTFNYGAKVFTGTRPLEITNNGNKISFENAYGSALDIYSFGEHQDWYIPIKIIGYKN